MLFHHITNINNISVGDLEDRFSKQEGKKQAPEWSIECFIPVQFYSLLELIHFTLMLSFWALFSRGVSEWVHWSCMSWYTIMQVLAKKSLIVYYSLRDWKVFLSFVSCQQDKIYCKKKKKLYQEKVKFAA